MKNQNQNEVLSKDYGKDLNDSEKVFKESDSYDGDQIMEIDIHEDDSPPPLRRSTRLHNLTWVYYNNLVVSHPIQAYCTLSHPPTDHQVFLSKIDQDILPQTYEEAKVNEV